MSATHRHQLGPLTFWEGDNKLRIQRHLRCGSESAGREIPNRNRRLLMFQGSPGKAREESLLAVSVADCNLLVLLNMELLSFVLPCCKMIGDRMSK